MGKWKVWLHLNISSFLLPAKSTLLSGTSTIRLRTKKNKNGLVTLYQDMESCGGYEDIRVMWEMIHTSYHCDEHRIRDGKRPNFLWKFCLRPT